MTRKRRVAKGRRTELPSNPAITFVLLTGDYAPGPIDNWVECFQAGDFGFPTLDEVLDAHYDALVAEAKQHGFKPHFQTGEPPSGAAFEAWKAAFLERHR